MSYKVKDTKGKDFPPLSEGVHVGVCYGIYFIGTQRTEWQGKEKWIDKVVIAWEVPEERINLGEKGVEKYGKADMPRAISATYTCSLGKKANLRRDLEAWRGKQFTEEELKGFDMENLLGKACQLQVSHTHKNDKTYASVIGIMSLPKGFAKPVAENKLKIWSIRELDDPEDPDVPDWIKKRGSESKEVTGDADPEPEGDAKDESTDHPPEGGDDELPF